MPQEFHTRWDNEEGLDGNIATGGSVYLTPPPPPSPPSTSNYSADTGDEEMM